MALRFLANGLTTQKFLLNRHIIQIPPISNRPGYVRSYSESPICSEKGNDDLSVHISPDGDWWLGTEIYAAKHNPSNYVRSIKLPANFDEDNHQLGSLPESSFTVMYDTGLLDPSLFPTTPLSGKTSASQNPTTIKSLDHDR